MFPFFSGLRLVVTVQAEGFDASDYFPTTTQGCVNLVPSATTKSSYVVNASASPGRCNPLSKFRYRINLKYMWTIFCLPWYVLVLTTVRSTFRITVVVCGLDQTGLSLVTLWWHIALAYFVVCPNFFYFNTLRLFYIVRDGLHSDVDCQDPNLGLSSQVSHSLNSSF